MLTCGLSPLGLKVVIGARKLAALQRTACLQKLPWEAWEFEYLSRHASSLEPISWHVFRIHLARNDCAAGHVQCDCCRKHAIWSPTKHRRMITVLEGSSEFTRLSDRSTEKGWDLHNERRSRCRSLPINSALTSEAVHGLNTTTADDSSHSELVHFQLIPRPFCLRQAFQASDMIVLSPSAGVKAWDWMLPIDYSTILPVRGLVDYMN
jgi:hypothetical protein